MKKLTLIGKLALSFSVRTFGATLNSGLSSKSNNNIEKARPNTLQYVEPDDGSTPYLVKKYADGTISDEPFKLITFTDTHIKNGNEPSDIISLTVIERVIKQKKPDLVVITGDVCLGAETLKGIDALAKVFEENKTYWAVVLGNHDGEDVNGPTRKEIIRYYETKPYSLTKKGTIDVGEGNYIINLTCSTGISQTLVFMDSGFSSATTENCEKYGYSYAAGYDFIKPEQIDWYRNSLSTIKAENSGVMPNSTLFIHIPLYEQNFVSVRAFDYGNKLEKCCASKINSGMFKCIKEIGSTERVVCGHDHINNYAVNYEGIRFIQSQSLSFGSYHARKKTIAIIAKKLRPKKFMYSDGHTEFTANADGTMIDTPCFNDLNLELFEGLEEHFIANGTPYPKNNIS